MQAFWQATMLPDVLTYIAGGLWWHHDVNTLLVTMTTDLEWKTFSVLSVNCLPYLMLRDIRITVPNKVK